MGDRRSFNTASIGPHTFSCAQHNEYYRLDCKLIKIRPTIGSFDDGNMAVRFHHSTNEMSLCLNALKNEVFIPYDQLTGFRIAEYKELEVSLLPNFKRRYYQNGIEVRVDPTNGLLEKAASLLIIPRKNVNLANLLMIENIIGKYRIDISLTNNTIPGVQDDSANLSDEIYVKFFMNAERGGVIVPQGISLDRIIQTIAERFHFNINSNLTTYKNGKGVIIAIRDEEDWRVAKWESRYSKKAGVELHLI
ncbi:14069_t:CDS:2 [Funneliformis geosporum]|uniref:8934_t:CDS:1 n=1 Tax=Funneliformis geosporum TaxID=1117311 RepID=A0A9W4SBB9_9GLOM|nr:8934_t:CDS:2 [Funneliformis geosporum]CAI2164463.1 14069_t:CDS:2 [Funneliformis geosporum]